MHVFGRRSVSLRQTMFTMRVVEHQISCPIHSSYQATLEAGLVQRLHADQTIDHLRSHTSNRFAADASQVVVQGLIDRSALLLGARQAVEVVEYIAAIGVQLKV